LLKLLLFLFIIIIIYIIIILSLLLVIIIMILLIHNASGWSGSFYNYNYLLAKQPGTLASRSSDSFVYLANLLVE